MMSRSRATRALFPVRRPIVILALRTHFPSCSPVARRHMLIPSIPVPPVPTRLGCTADEVRVATDVVFGRRSARAGGHAPTDVSCSTGKRLMRDSSVRRETTVVTGDGDSRFAVVVRVRGRVGRTSAAMMAFVVTGDEVQSVVNCASTTLLLLLSEPGLFVAVGAHRIRGVRQAVDEGELMRSAGGTSTLCLTLEVFLFLLSAIALRHVEKGEGRGGRGRRRERDIRRRKEVNGKGNGGGAEEEEVVVNRGQAAPFASDEEVARSEREETGHLCCHSCAVESSSEKARKA
jgi:hypothetical protein